MALIDFPTAALVRSGDTNPGGGGMTTSSTTNQSVLNAYGEDALSANNTTVVAPGAHFTVAGHVVPWWIGLIVALCVWAFFDAKSEKDDLKEVKVGFANSLKVTLFVIAWITLLKWVFGLYAVPGVSPLIEAV